MNKNDAHLNIEAAGEKHGWKTRSLPRIAGEKAVIIVTLKNGTQIKTYAESVGGAANDLTDFAMSIVGEGL